MVTHLIANQRLLVKGYARSSRASVANLIAEVKIMDAYKMRIISDLEWIFEELSKGNIINKEDLVIKSIPEAIKMLKESEK